MIVSSDIDRASSAIDPPRSAEAIASELRFCCIMYSIALSTTAPAWLRWAGDSLVSSDMARSLCNRFQIARFQIAFDRLQGPHPGKQAAFRKQGGMAAAFGNHPVLQHDDFIRIHDGGQAMGDHQRGAAVRDRVQGGLNLLLRAA